MTFEIYLTKKYIPKDDWKTLIDTISYYNGYFKSWRILVYNECNRIRYFVETDCNLPVTIGGMDSFLLKEIESATIPELFSSMLIMPPSDYNILDLINYFSIKDKGQLKCITIDFRKFYDHKILSSIHLYVKKNGVNKKYRMICGIPSYILSINFDRNKRFFYKGAPKYLDISKNLHLLRSDCVSSLFKVDTFPYLPGNYYLSLNDYSFDKHSIIVGTSGCGKSKFISSFVEQIKKNSFMRENYKVVVIDPHASLENDIGGYGRVIDFKTIEDSISLFMNQKEDAIASTELIMELFKSFIADQYNSKLERVLRHSIYLLLAKEEFQFTSLRKLLLDIEYRNSLVQELRSELPMSVVSFFLSDFNDLKNKSYGEAISPIISFLDEMEMIPVFNNESTSTLLEDVISENFLVLFSLDKMMLGDKVTKTISGFVMQQLLMLVQKHCFTEHIIFIVDEVAVIENPILCRFLSEARKYHLSLVLAGQYFNQISEKLRDAIFSNVSNYYIFRVSRLDANVLVDNFQMKIPIQDDRDQKIRLLTGLNHRECIIRVDSNGKLLPAMKVRTRDFISCPRIQSESTSKSFVKEEPMNNKKEKSFIVNSHVNLKDILIQNSTFKGGTFHE